MRQVCDSPRHGSDAPPACLRHARSTLGDEDAVEALLVCVSDETVHLGSALHGPGHGFVHVGLIDGDFRMLVKPSVGVLAHATQRDSRYRHPVNAPHFEPELFTWEFAADPYPAYASLREHSPVHRTTLPSGVEAWLVTRYTDAKQALADQRLSKNPVHHSDDARGKSKTGIPGERSANLMTHLLNIDPPDHTRLRRLVSKAFTPVASPSSPPASKS